MRGDQIDAKIIGAFFLIAMVSSLTGGGLIESVFGSPDYLTLVSEKEGQLSAGMILEHINGLAVLGIAFFMFPILKKYSEKIAIAYVGLRLFESLFCIVNALIPLVLIDISQEFIKASEVEPASFQILGDIVLAARGHITALMVPLFFSFSALLLYFSMYQTKLVPRFISIWGMVASVMVLCLNLAEFNMMMNMILVLPIITNEVFLGIWLITKGFNPMLLKEHAR